MRIYFKKGWVLKPIPPHDLQDEPRIQELRTEPVPECEHEHFTIHGYNRIGEGTCDDCGRVVNLSILFNNLAQRMQKIEGGFAMRSVADFGANQVVVERTGEIQELSVEIENKVTRVVAGLNALGTKLAPIMSRLKNPEAPKQPEPRPSKNSKLGEDLQRSIDGLDEIIAMVDTLDKLCEV